MSIERLQRDGFVVERHGDGTSTYFVYAGHMKHVELMPAAGTLSVPTLVSTIPSTPRIWSRHFGRSRSPAWSTAFRSPIAKAIRTRP